MRRVFFFLASFLLVLAVGASIARADQPEPTKEPHGRPTQVGPQLKPEKGESNKAEENKDTEKGNKRRGIFGTASVVSDGGMTVTTRQGDVFTVTFNDKTKFHVPSKRDATASDLQAGDRVAVNGTWSGDNFVAKKVMVAPGKPTIQHRVGTVTAYGGGEITIKTVQGDSEIFKVASDVEIRGPKGVTSVGEGDRVTVVAGRAPGAETPTARAIVVHPK